MYSALFFKCIALYLTAAVLPLHLKVYYSLSDEKLSVLLECYHPGVTVVSHHWQARVFKVTEGLFSNDFNGIITRQIPLQSTGIDWITVLLLNILF